MSSGTRYRWKKEGNWVSIENFTKVICNLIYY